MDLSLTGAQQQSLICPIKTFVISRHRIQILWTDILEIRWLAPVSLTLYLNSPGFVPWLTKIRSPVTNPLNIQVNSTDTAMILSISPIESDHDALQEILNGSGFRAQWVLHSAPTLKLALPLVRSNQVEIVVSERDLGPDTWKDVLAELLTLTGPPRLIVTSRIADEYLWRSPRFCTIRSAWTASSASTL